MTKTEYNVILQELRQLAEQHKGSSNLEDILRNHLLDKVLAGMDYSFSIELYNEIQGEIRNGTK